MVGYSAAPCASAGLARCWVQSTMVPRLRHVSTLESANATWRGRRRWCR